MLRLDFAFSKMVVPSSMSRSSQVNPAGLKNCIRPVVLESTFIDYRNLAAVSCSVSKSLTRYNLTRKVVFGNVAANWG